MTILPVLFFATLCDPAPALEGKRLFVEGKFSEAEMLFRRALEERCGPAQFIADRVNLAATLRERHAMAEALEVLQAVLDVAQAPPESQIPYWNTLALLEEQAEHRDRAEAAYRRAIALWTPSSPLGSELWTNYARHCMMQGRLMEAEEALQRARQPGRPVAYDLNFAELRRLQGSPREAEAVLRALLVERPEMPRQSRATVNNNLASLAAARGAKKEAESLWRAAIQAWREVYGPSHPNVAQGLNNLAAHYVSRKRLAEAEALYREAAAMYEHPKLLNNLAALLHQRGHLPEAEEFYRRALALYGTKPTRDAIQSHGNLAVLLAELRRDTESHEHFEAVMGLLPLALPADEPTVARYLENYERLLRRLREPADAERVAAISTRYRVRSVLRRDN